MLNRSVRFGLGSGVLLLVAAGTFALGRYAWPKPMTEEIRIPAVSPQEPATELPDAKDVRWLEFSGFQTAEKVRSIRGRIWCRGMIGNLGVVTVASEPPSEGTSFRFPEVNLYLYKPIKGGFLKERIYTFDAEERLDGTGALKDLFFADIDGSSRSVLVVVLACTERRYFQGDGGYAGTFSSRAIVVYREEDGRLQEIIASSAAPFDIALWCKGSQEEDEDIIARKERYYLRQFKRENLRVLLRNHFPLR